MARVGENAPTAQLNVNSHFQNDFVNERQRSEMGADEADPNNTNVDERHRFACARVCNTSNSRRGVADPLNPNAIGQVPDYIHNP